MLDLSGSVFFQFALIVWVWTSSHSGRAGSSMLFREVLLSARLKDYELELPLTDEQSVPPPSWRALLSCPGAGAREDGLCCGMGLGHPTASGAVNCRFVPPSQLLQGQGCSAAFKGEEGFWSCEIMICQIFLVYLISYCFFLIIMDLLWNRNCCFTKISANCYHDC